MRLIDHLPSKYDMASSINVKFTTPVVFGGAETKDRRGGYDQIGINSKHSCKDDSPAGKVCI
jgi:hypothetical protein